MTVHTSGKFGVTQKKELDLLNEMERLGIHESDIVEEFLRGSGAGGQHRNKTSTRVRLFHRPSGIEVSYQRERSQALNRFFARRLLCEKFQVAALGASPEKAAEQARIRKQKARRVRRQESHVPPGKPEA